jgi:molybdopterin-guanine dinucleotide biosynthesis protein A
MGFDKAFADLGGEPMVNRSLTALREAGAEEIHAIGGDQKRLTGLGDLWVPDRWPGEGPLGGVITGLGSAHHDVAVVLACDLPHVDARTVLELRDRLVAAPEADAVVPEVDGRLQPVLASYRVSSVVAMEDDFVAGVRSLQVALRSLALVTIDPDNLGAFVDVDHPADLDRERG